jgi:hypothetical protein
MLNEWLKVAHAEKVQHEEGREVMTLLEGLPVSELRKIADGSTIAALYPHLTKEAYGDCPSTGNGEPVTFLDRFKGTPLFDQAMALEQEEIQADMLQQQKREQQDMEPSVWSLRDKIRLKKHMLELELAKQEAGAPPAAVPGQPAQGAGAPGDVPPEGVQDSSQGLGGGVAKVGGAKTALSAETISKVVAPRAKLTGLPQAHLERLHGLAGKLTDKAKSTSTDLRKTISLVGQGEALKKSLPKIAEAAEDKVAFADMLGRERARDDFAKEAHIGMLTSYGARAGEAMAKTALSMGVGAIPDMLSRAAPAAGRMLGQATRFAVKNPALTGAAVGAAGGALAGGPGNRIGGALGGASLGAGVGGLAGGAASAMKANPAGGIGGALQTAGQGMISKAQSALGGLKAPGAAPGGGTGTLLGSPPKF